MPAGRPLTEPWTVAEIDAARTKKLPTVKREQTITMPDGATHRVKVLSPGWAITQTHFYAQTMDGKWHCYTTQQMLRAGTLFIGFQGALS